MPRYELECVVALVVVALISSIVFFLDRPKEGKIKLPFHDEEVEAEGEPYEVLDGGQSDPFDVTKPVDVVDGEPLDEEEFWANVRSSPC